MGRARQRAFFLLHFCYKLYIIACVSVSLERQILVTNSLQKQLYMPGQKCYSNLVASERPWYHKSDAITEEKLVQPQRRHTKEE
jgi:hypothetical protein